MFLSKYTCFLYSCIYIKCMRRPIFFPSHIEINGKGFDWCLGGAFLPLFFSFFPPGSLYFSTGHLPSGKVVVPSQWLVTSSDFLTGPCQRWEIHGNYGCDNSGGALAEFVCPCQQMELRWTLAPLPTQKLCLWLGSTVVAQRLAVWSRVHKENALFMGFFVLSFSTMGVTSYNTDGASRVWWKWFIKPLLLEEKSAFVAVDCAVWPGWGGSSCQVPFPW